MNEIIRKGEVKAKVWTPIEKIEPSAMQQIYAMTEHPLLYKWVSIMPDVHAGIGATIGSVIPLQEGIIPSAVGVDIGCGMCAVKTNLPVSVLEERKQAIHDEIIANIPRGFSHRTPTQLDSVTKFTPMSFFDHIDEYQITSSKPLVPQLGTLGGGNHFIELQQDAEGNIWVMLHSGSRNIGNALAVKHIRISKDYIVKSKIQVAKDLDFLIEGTPEFDVYVKDMNFAMDFAKWNRYVMMECIKEVLKETFSGIEFTEIANIHHNYAAKEQHFGQDIWVHRKGATHVTSSVTGIIPGSMGAPSYIVKGTDEQNSYKSCSHGAGRTMSRSGAKKSITLETFTSQMKGIFTQSVDIHHLDEAPDAYKNIDEVMCNQTDLVTIQHKLIPVLNIKG